MSLRHDLAKVLAADARYTVDAYAFVFESLEHAKSSRRKRERTSVRDRPKPVQRSRHVNGRELCESVRRLALDHYGYMAMTVLMLWGIRSTRDVGEIVFNLIASGELKKTHADSKADFVNVFDFEKAFRSDFVVPLDEVA